MSESQSSELLEEAKLQVSISYGSLNASFSGEPADVSRAVNEFIAKNIPSIALANQISVNYSVQDLISKFQDFIKLTPEGPRIWSGEKELSDKEIVALQLVAERIANESGAGRSAASLSKLQEATSLNPKSLSSRLSELAKAGYAVRETSGAETHFRISTQGVEWLTRILSKKGSKEKV
jgi:DNA-binding MarR family transcriptional regulator